ncbi:MAG: hypothetical protein EYC69_09115 [Bacteroidetes bacterium]|nr:MAG: hypothetical protein EYC69_09115 [Bacteroidota bacterium]
MDAIYLSQSKMKIMTQRSVIVFLFILFQSLQIFAGNLDKAFERLRVYDYFNARELFLKSMKKDAAAAGFGLARIHSSNDNPFYNLDSARQFILISDSVFILLKEKTKQEYLEYGVRAESINQLKDSICTLAFSSAEQSASLEKLDHYLMAFAFCGKKDEATNLRNSIAFQIAKNANTSVAYSHFLQSYPEAEEFKDAQNRFYERVFEEETQSQQLGAYERFLSLYPESPYKMQAERMIYSLSTSQGILAEYKAFISRYPDNRYVREAWREIYRISMQDYDEQTYLQFKFDYPNYPFMDELENDYLRQTSLFLPFNNNSHWGFINESGAEMIPAVYDEVNYFSEGLAAVSKDGKYGYVNKSGKVMIPFMWDDAEAFKNNSAVVSKGNKSGLINKSGEFLVPVEYDEITEPVEDICVVVKNDKAGYVHKTGQALTKLDFDIASDFRDGFAIVGIDELFGLISAQGNMVVEAIYENLSWASSELLKVGLNDKWGLINRVGEVVLPIEYDGVGDFHNGRALIAKNGKCGFINTHVEIVISPVYRYTENLLSSAIFINGFVVLSTKGKNVVLDTLGRKIEFPGYENTDRPNEGLIPVQKNKKWGYVDYSGRLRISCTFKDANPFQGGTAIVKSENGYGIINTEGAWLLAPAFDDISRSGENFLLVQHGMFGLASKSGGLLTACEFDRIEILFDKVAMLQREDSRSYISLSTGKVIWGDLQ